MNRATRIALPRIVLPSVAAVLVLIGGLLFWQTWPRTLTLSGESVSDTAEFQLSARRYALQADLLPQCQYTFYLTPKGQLWNRAGKAVASASGESALSVQTDPLSAGCYFVHGFTVPEEGCSWVLRFQPL